MDNEREFFAISISESIGAVSALVLRPKDPLAVLVLAHGAGAGMSHVFMESLAMELASRSIASVRYNFPYVENRKNRPDPPAIAEKTVGVLINEVHERFPGVPLFAGGKSFGGRMTSQRLDKDRPSFVKGIVFYGFPLHPVGQPSVSRADHLSNVRIPMLFLQGARDKMAEVELLNKVTEGLPTATVLTWEGADHSFKAGKQQLIPQLAEQTRLWIETILKI